jgi:hypothetical protein
VKTAMTMEQWAQWLGDEAQTRIEDSNGDVLVLCRNKAGKVAEEGGTHHATAAAALHNKPFGFTHADVAVLRRLAADCAPEGYVSGPVDRIADRIEALLAPAEVTA